MAQTDLAAYTRYQSVAIQDVLQMDDIWSQKARHRMTTARARERTYLPFSSMSSEATLAMQQLTNNDKVESDKSPSVTTTRPKQRQRRKSKNGSKSSDTPSVTEAEHVCSVKLSNIYEKLGAEQKLEGDITDPTTWEAENRTKFVLGGGKMDNAMEIVEIVNADDPKPDPVTAAVEADHDEQVISEIARINSINKCNVWFEAHEGMVDSDKAVTGSLNELHDKSNKPLKRK